MKNVKNLKKVLKCVGELDALAQSTTPEERRQLLRRIKDCVIDAISEISKNCLNGNIEYKKCDLDKLEKYKEILRKISKKTSAKTRKRYIIQKGGFLPLLLPPALSLLASVVGSAIAKKIK